MSVLTYPMTIKDVGRFEGIVTSAISFTRDIDEADFVRLCDRLCSAGIAPSTPNLRVANLCIGDEGCAAVVRLIKAAGRRLVHFDFSGAWVTDRRLRDICHAISEFSVASTLVVDAENAGPDGIVAIADLVRTTKSLARLSVYFGMGTFSDIPRSAMPLLNALEHNTTIVRVDLPFLVDEELVQLSRVIHNNCTLTHILAITGTDRSPESDTDKMIVAATRENTTLLWLHLVLPSQEHRTQMKLMMLDNAVLRRNGLEGISRYDAPRLIDAMNRKGFGVRRANVLIEDMHRYEGPLHLSKTPHKHDTQRVVSRALVVASSPLAALCGGDPMAAGGDGPGRAPSNPTPVGAFFGNPLCDRGILSAVAACMGVEPATGLEPGGTHFRLLQQQWARD